MAEGWLRHLAGDQFEAFSAGAKPTGHIHPLAIQAMAEVGVDISGHRSKPLEEFASQKFHYLITVCDGAREACPTHAGAIEQLHWSFDDPARATGSEKQRMNVFRRVRDEIRGKIEGFIRG